MGLKSRFVWHTINIFIENLPLSLWLSFHDLSYPSQFGWTSSQQKVYLNFLLTFPYIFLCLSSHRMCGSGDWSLRTHQDQPFSLVLCKIYQQLKCNNCLIQFMQKKDETYMKYHNSYQNFVNIFSAEKKGNLTSNINDLDWYKYFTSEMRHSLC